MKPEKGTGNVLSCGGKCLDIPLLDLSLLSSFPDHRLLIRAGEQKHLYISDTSEIGTSCEKAVIRRNGRATPGSNMR